MIYIEIVVAALAVLVTVLPAWGKIPRNRLVGVRSRALLASDENWRRGHRAAVIPMTLMSGLAIIAGLIAIAFGFVNEPFAVVALALVLLAGAVWSLAAANKAVEDRSSSTR